MTYQQNKQKNNSQSGVTLILGILLLSAILAISFSLTTIIFIEVRSSSDLLRTEGSLYGATGVGEQALFNYIRELPSPSYTSSFPNNVSLNGNPEVSTSTDPSFVDSIPAGSTFSSSKKRYSFCSTESTTQGCNFKKVVVKYLSSSGPSNPLYVYVCQWDPNNTVPPNSAPCSLEDVDEGYWVAPISDTPVCGSTGATIQSANGSVTLVPSTNCVSFLLDPDLQQEMIITNPVGTGPIGYSVSTYDQNFEPKGLPYTDKTGIIVETQNGPVGRRIKVEIPRQ